MDETKDPSIGISYRVALIGSRELVLQSFVDRDCEVSRLNELLDKLRDASERQYAYGKIEEIKLNIKQEEKNAADQQVNIEATDAGIKAGWENGKRKGDVRMTAAQIEQQRKTYAIAEGIKIRMASLKAALVEWEAKLGT
jgi:hypothetical protein